MLAPQLYVKRFTPVRIALLAVFTLIFITALNHVHNFRNAAAVRPSIARRKEDASVASTNADATSMDTDAPEQQTRLERCVVYDRPPRTGSTTVSRALAECLLTLKWPSPITSTPEQRSSAITRGLRIARDELAVVKGHMLMSEDDVRQLRKECDQTFFITNTARLDDRLWSAAKMSLSWKNGNVSLVSDQVNKRAHEWLDAHGRRQAAYLEAYPFTNVTGPLVMTGESTTHDIATYWRTVRTGGFAYDYVVRKSNMADDLSALLQAFGCSSQFQTQNVHSVKAEQESASSKGESVSARSIDGRDEDIEAKLERIVPGGQGARHARLMRVAATNDEGLGRLRAMLAERQKSTGLQKVAA